MLTLKQTKPTVTAHFKHSFEVLVAVIGLILQKLVSGQLSFPSTILKLDHETKNYLPNIAFDANWSSKVTGKIAECNKRFIE